MLLHDNNFVVDIEDLIYDFLDYRKNKSFKKKETKMRNNFPFQSLIEGVDFEAPAQKFVPHQFDQQNIKLDQYENLIGCSQNKLSKQLEIIIDEILNEYEYDGSPILDKTIDRETLQQIIQKIIKLAAERIDELKNIIGGVQNIETKNFYTNNYDLLKALIEALVINNIFIKRKHLQHDFEKFVPY